MSCPFITRNLASNFSRELALPLEGEVRRTHDEDALCEAAQLKFADQQARHDRLAGAGVVREQEPHPRELEQVVVNSLKLVRQRIHAGYRESEVRVELVGDAEGVGLDAQAEAGARRRRRSARASTTVRPSRSLVVSVTLRKRSECIPTNPTTQLAGPLAWTVSIRMGSLKRDPIRIWPGLMTPMTSARFTLPTPLERSILAHASTRGLPGGRSRSPEREQCYRPTSTAAIVRRTGVAANTSLSPLGRRRVPGQRAPVQAMAAVGCQVGYRLA